MRETDIFKSAKMFLNKVTLTRLICFPELLANTLSLVRKTVYVSSSQCCRLFQVEKVSIGNDSRGPGHGVFVEEIEVAAPSEEAVVFPCRCWLAEDEGDGKTARVLQPGEAVSAPYESK